MGASQQAFVRTTQNTSKSFMVNNIFVLRHEGVPLKA